MSFKLNRELNSIYLIRNVTNNKVYIGRSVNPTIRINQHFSDLRRGKGFKSLQRDFDKYGENSFETEILETHSTEIDARDREDFYISKFNSIKNGYNTRHSKPRGSRSVSTTVTDAEFEVISAEAEKSGASLSLWIKEAITERLERLNLNE